MWFWVSLHYATFALGSDGRGRVIHAPPIAKWALGRDMADVLNVYHYKGADIRQMP